MAQRLRATSNQGLVASPNVTVPKPTGTADGDGLVAWIAIDQGTAITITPPAGWTLELRTDETTNLTLAMYRKVASSEGVNWTWSFSANVSGIALVAAVQGSDRANPVGASAGQADTAATLSTVPTMSADGPDHLILCAFIQAAVITWTTPMGMVEVVETAGGGIQIELAMQQGQGPGATGPRQALASAAGTTIGAGVVLATDRRVTQLYDTAVFDDEQIGVAVFG